MKNSSYARKKRQLKRLSGRLQQVMADPSVYSREVADVLVKKIRSLLIELKRVVSVLELKKALGVVAVLFGIMATEKMSAQTFASPVTNPFGLDTVAEYSVPAIADIDGDGDMDVFVAEEYGGVQYFENIGTANAPQFAAPVLDTFGIAGSSMFYMRPVFADIDNDGDQDLFLGDFYGFYGGTIMYQQNTGTSTSPQFAAPTSNPFGISISAFAALPDFADLDNDGDLDLIVGHEYGNMTYFQNTGTAAGPQFAAGQTNPFGLSATYYFAAPTFVDFDKDGDYDLLVGEYYGGLQYFQNTGTNTSPAFATPQKNPFGLVSTVYAAFPSVADLDGDGDVDLLVGEYYGNLKYFENLEPHAGLGEQAAFKLSLFPNPAADVLNVDAEDPISFIQVINVAGVVVLEIENPQAAIDVSALPEGAYTLKVMNVHDEVVNEKFIKS